MTVITGRRRMGKTLLALHFLIFWFRFIYKNFSAIENENFDYVRKIVDLDYKTYCGKILEKFYHALYWSTKQYNRIGSYWEKVIKTKLTYVAINDLEKKCVIADIKLSKHKINLSQLKQKSQKLIVRYKNHDIQWVGLNLSDIGKHLF